MQLGFGLGFVLLLVGAVWSARLVADYRRDKAIESATSFSAPREPRAGGGGGGGGRRGGSLSWR